MNKKKITIEVDPIILTTIAGITLSNFEQLFADGLLTDKGVDEFHACLYELISAGAEAGKLPR